MAGENNEDGRAEIRAKIIRAVLIDNGFDDQTAVTIREGSPTLVYLTPPGEAWSSPTSDFIEVVGVATGAISHSQLKMDSLELVALDAGDTSGVAWTIAEDLAKQQVAGKLSKAGFEAALRDTRRDVEFDDPPVANAQG